MRLVFPVPSIARPHSSITHNPACFPSSLSFILAQLIRATGMLNIRLSLLIKPFASTSTAVEELFAGVATGECPAAVAGLDADFAHVCMKERRRGFVVVVEVS